MMIMTMMIVVFSITFIVDIIIVVFSFTLYFIYYPHWRMREEMRNTL